MCMESKSHLLPRSLAKVLVQSSAKELGVFLRGVVKYDSEGSMPNFGAYTLVETLFVTSIAPLLDEQKAQDERRKRNAAIGGRASAKVRIEGRGLRVEENEGTTRVEGCAQSARVEDCGLREQENEGTKERTEKEPKKETKNEKWGKYAEVLEGYQQKARELRDEDSRVSVPAEKEKTTRVEGSVRSARVEGRGETRIAGNEETKGNEGETKETKEKRGGTPSVAPAQQKGADTACFKTWHALEALGYPPCVNVGHLLRVILSCERAGISSEEMVAEVKAYYDSQVSLEKDKQVLPPLADLLVEMFGIKTLAV